jgi:hypothetical protein
MHTLADMSEMKEASFPMNAMAVRRSFAEKNRDGEALATSLRRRNLSVH